MKVSNKADVCYEEIPASLVRVPCPICNSERRVPVYAGTITAKDRGRRPRYSYNVWVHGHHPIVRCTDCGLLYACPRDSPDTLTRASAGGSIASYLSETNAKVSWSRREVQRIRRLPGARGKLLDVGCATGFFLRAAADAGFDVHGCDPWVEAAAVAQQQFGARVRVGPFEAQDYRAGQFRVVALWDVIEHVEEPLKLLQGLHHVLAPGGWLVLTTPDVSSFSRRLLGGRWQYFERHHLSYFDPRTITKVLRRVGFPRVLARSVRGAYSLSYAAAYLAKWSPALSKVSLRLVKALWPGGDPVFWLPCGGMRVYAQKLCGG
jgi:2-polyprenyl-3-methyl-5-hydroxy-6-metoxy-1,4-benzoquinol methylase